MAVVLVTGGAGYIGSHACRRLAEAGHLPVTFDDFSTGWQDAVRFGPLEEGSLASTDDLDRAFEAHRPDAVMHFAARSLVGESCERPGLYWRNNVGGSLNLLEAMVRHGVGALVFSSTAAVYGEPDLDLIGEDTPARPVNPYGATKRSVETMIDGFAAAHGLSAVIFRYFNVAGAATDAGIGEQHRPETHLVPLVLEAARGTRPELRVFGEDYPTPDGTCIRDYVHVEDLVEAHLLGLERLAGGRDNGAVTTLNLGIGHGHSVREVITRAEAVTGCQVPRVPAPRRAGDPARLVCNPARAAEVLGWQAERGLDDMIADAWKWTAQKGYEH